MNIFTSLFRSIKKSRVMAKAIVAEKNHSDMEKYRKKLYDFLLRDQILSFISELGFDYFSELLSQLKAMGLSYSKKGDYIPVAAFCFLEPLSWVVNYHTDSISISFDTLCLLLQNFFDGKNDYSSLVDQASEKNIIGEVVVNQDANQDSVRAYVGSEVSEELERIREKNKK